MGGVAAGAVLRRRLRAAGKNVEGLISGESPGLELLLKSSGNPKIPTLEEAMNEALIPEEIEHFTTHLRPLVERNESKGMSAVAYLGAVKQEG